MYIPILDAEFYKCLLSQDIYKILLFKSSISNFLCSSVNFIYLETILLDAYMFKIYLSW